MEAPIFILPGGLSIQRAEKLIIFVIKGTEIILQLVLGDDSTVVARYHPREIVIIGNGQPAYLEIFPEGREMVDLIVTTFVYVEMLRKDTSESLGIYTY